MGIPAALINDLKHIPRDTQAAVLMRHAARFPIRDPQNYAEAELTEEGIRTAEELGGLVRANFSVGRLLSSPVSRCRATAAALARGAGWDAPVATDERLSHEFMAPVWYLLQRARVRGPMPFQVRAALRLMLPVREEISTVESPVRAQFGKDRLPALDVLVSHDTVVGAVVGSLLGAPVIGPDWPGYLEGLLVWCAGDRVTARWRGKEYPFSKSFERIE